MEVAPLTLVVLATFFSSIFAAHLPPYLKKCRRNDEQCALESAQAALPHFINGDKNFKVHSLNPLLVPKMEIAKGGLKIKMTNAQIHFVENLTFKKIRIDFKNLIFGYTFHSPICKLLSDYEVEGKILVLPISGAGKCNITLVDAEFDYEASCKLERRADGKEYLKFVNGTHRTVKLGGATYSLTNLFRGDKALEKTTLDFMNDSWREIYEELSPVFLESMEQQERATLNSLAGTIPINELFLD